MGKRQPKVPPGSRSHYENKLTGTTTGRRSGKSAVVQRLPRLHDYQLIAMDELMSLSGLKDVMESDPWGRDRSESRTDTEVRNRLMSKQELFMELYGGKRKVQTIDATVDLGFVEEGDWLEALADGGRDKDGLPEQVPERGKRYRVERFYIAPYGLGVVLRDEFDQPLDPYPYRGYVFMNFRPIDQSGQNVRCEVKFKKVKDDEPISITPI